MSSVTPIRSARAVDARRLAALLGEDPGVADRGDRREVAYRSLAAGVERLVADGRIPLSTRLPGERSLAAALGVSRTTTTAAYQLLRDRGYLTVSQGAQARVTLPPGAVDPLAAPDLVTPDGVVVDLAYATMTADAGVLRRGYEAALAALPAVLPGHGYDPYGQPALREAIAARYTARGVSTDPSQVLVTTGAGRAVALVIEALTVPGDGVLVEAPTYPNVLDYLVSRARRPVPVSFPVDPLPGEPGGWDLDAMETAMTQARPRIAYLIPDFHNPTGRLMSPAERERLCGAARRAGTRLVVDETLVDLALDAEAPLPMSACDRSVVAIGSASKSFWAGLRIGWIRAERDLIDDLARRRSVDDLGTPIVEQLAAAHVLGLADEVLPVRLDRLRSSRDAVLDVLGQRLPDWTVTSRAVGGLALWVRLPVAVGTAVCAEVAHHGVRLVPGPRFGVGGGFERYLRVPFTHSADDLRRATHAIADAYEAVVGGSAVGGDVEPGLRFA